MDSCKPRANAWQWMAEMPFWTPPLKKMIKRMSCDAAALGVTTHQLQFSWETVISGDEQVLSESVF